jgi:DNA polymerase III subunit epsilon
MSHPSQQPTFVAVDVETTGLNPDYDAIIEVAAVVFHGEEILDQWSSLVNPQRDLPPSLPG